jgi:hypothetical protein
VIIGAQKAGTTTIYRWLRDHPDVVARNKEIGYFSQEYHRGPEWYARQFPSAQEREQFRAEHGRALITGEATPEYMLDPRAPRRMARLIPDVRLIVSLRDPVDRAYSQFQMNRLKGIEPVDSFEEALALEDPCFAFLGAAGQTERKDPTAREWTHYLGRGHYAESLLRWFAVFPREQFCILAMEDLNRDGEATVALLERFLGLAPHARDALPAHNEGSYAPLPDATRSALIDYFRPHNERLYELLGRDFGWATGARAPLPSA